MTRSSSAGRPPVQPWTLRSGALAAIAGAAVIVVVLLPPGLPDFTPSWSTAVVGLLAFAAALFSGSAATESALTSRRALGQQLYELARSVHVDLTTGEVADARDRLGTLGRQRKDFWKYSTVPVPGGDQLRRILDDERLYCPPGAESAEERMSGIRRDWFNILWCFQRIHAAHTLLAQAPDDAAYGMETPSEFLARLVRSQVRFLNEEFSQTRTALEEYFNQPVDDLDSSEALRLLVEELVPDVEVGAWSQLLTTHSGPVLRSILTKRKHAELPLERLTDAQFEALHMELTRETAAAGQDRSPFLVRLRKRAGAVDGTAADARLLRSRADQLERATPRS